MADPAEQVASPGLEVERGPLPITSVEAIAMRQELEHLLGRVESALITASVHETLPAAASLGEGLAEFPGEITLSSISVVDTGGNRKEGEIAADMRSPEGLVAATPRAFRATAEAIASAKAMLQEFPDLVQRQDYASARSQWLEIRDLLWNHYPLEGVFGQPEIRAIWLDRASIVRAGSERGLAQIFDRLAAAGINTVFFETVNAGYPIYPSRVAPEQNPLTRNWDPLAAAVKLAHDRGMELHAWVWTFAAGNQRHNALLNQPATYPGPLISAHPTWANYTQDGMMIPRGQTKPFLDPANPEVRRYLGGLLSEIVTRYEVDGVHFDYIRYPFQDPSAERSYGYGEVARREFEQLTGVDPMEITPDDRQLWQQWTDFRVAQVDEFVAEASQQLRNLRSDLVISVAVFPLTRHERLNKIQQNWEAWAREGHVDLVVPMTYAMDTNRLEQLTQPWLEEADLGSVLVLPAIRLLDLPEIVAVDQIQALRNVSAGGYALFAVENVSEELQGIFQRTQGRSPASSDMPIPYREPFAAAAARFEMLQREWRFLLGGDRLWIREPQLTQFQANVAELGAALDDLAADPSGEALQSAREALRAFRGEFEDWMGLHSLHNPYQIQSWDNRLQTLEVLLRYGDRFVLQRSQTP